MREGKRSATRDDRFGCAIESGGPAVVARCHVARASATDAATEGAVEMQRSLITFQ